MPDLLAHHRVELEKSGLDAAAIAAGGFYSENDPVKVARLLGRKGGTAKFGPCLVMPFPATDGSPSGFCQVKPDRPRTEPKKGKGGQEPKPIKYESPKGQPSRVYLPPLARVALADPTAPVLFTEGVKKCVAADVAGLACLGLVGVDAWSAPRPKGLGGERQGPRVLSDQLAAMAWAGRPVTIVYDSDAATNRNVRWAEWNLAKALTAAGAVVRVARLPAGPGGSKVGLDDYLVANGPDALRAVVAAATPAERPPREPPPPQPDGQPLVKELPNDPHRLARSYLRAVDDGGPPRLWFWRGEWHRWAGGCYQPVPDAEIVAAVNRHVKHDFDALYRIAFEAWQAAGADPKEEPVAVRVTGRLVADAVRAMEGLRCLPGSISQPCWLGETAGRPEPATVVAFPNALVDLPAYGRGEARCTCPPTPEFFSPTVMEFDFDAAAPGPTEWRKFLASLWPDDSASIDALQEWFGYCLTPDTSLEKLLMLIGPKRGGKSTIVHVQRHLVGVGNTVPLTLSGLGERFGMDGMLGKTLAVIPDAHLGRRADAVKAVEVLKSMVGRDPQSVERKNRDKLFVELPARFVIATNAVPTLPDAGGAFAERLVVLRLLRSFAGQENHRLKDRLLAELPGIFRWAVAGWRRLTERGRFVQPDSAAEVIRTVGDLSDPVAAFLRERAIIGPDECVPTAALFTAWVSYCEAKRTNPGTDASFGKDLLASVPGLAKRRPRDERGKPQWHYFGLRLRVAADEEEIPDPSDPRINPTRTLHREGSWVEPEEGDVEGELDRSMDHLDQFEVEVNGELFPAGDACEGGL